MIEEEWKDIPEFSEYMISNLGNVYNKRLGSLMSVSQTGHGHMKITLKSDWGPERCTRSVALLVAEAFVEKPNFMCDQLVVLDGDFSYVSAENLAWRPRWFAWKYTRQLKVPQPRHYENLPVLNVVTNAKYSSIIEAGTTEGLLFETIWESTYTGKSVYPTGSRFVVL